MQTLEVTRWRAVILISSVLLVAGFSASSGSNERQDKLTEADENAIRATIAAYRTAWLANDAKAVLKTFTDEAVLLPAHGAPAVAGIAAIEKYWFAAGGPPTTVTELNITVDQVSGNQTLAYARGLDSVAWTVIQAGTTRHHSHPGTYLNVMRKQPDGSWRIQVHMWDDGPEHVE
jgi:uncharacterized protein (TIGR02246 family)